jgi:AraC-like DNA-binding protein
MGAGDMAQIRALRYRRCMPFTLRGVIPGRLERSCSSHGDSIRFGSAAEGIERAEVHLSTLAFEPHRHDTYAIGITTDGVQSFGYRGARRICLPGQLHVLHPDELHDGAPTDDRGFGYRILYLAPELVRAALDDRALPFVADPVHDLTPATSRLAAVLREIDEPVDDLARTEIATTVADALVALGGGPAAQRIPIDLRAAEAARSYLAAHACEPTSAATLERIAGIDRYALARQFRRAFGTSPDRYRTMRRLGRARRLIEHGTPLAEAAAEAGFADQSHLTRQFTRTFGLTPARWAAVAATPVREDPGHARRTRLR